MRSFGRLVVGASQSKLDVKVTAYYSVPFVILYDNSHGYAILIFDMNI